MRLTLFIFYFIASGCGIDDSKQDTLNPTLAENIQRIEPPNKLTNETSYKNDVRPLIKRHCIYCHNGLVPFRKNLNKYSVAKEQAETMLSYMSGDGAKLMPPSGKLPDAKIATIQSWINGGLQP